MTADIGLKLAISFALGSKVVIDSDQSIIASVIAVCWRGSGLQYEIAWMHEGAMHSGWVDEWRLSEPTR